MHGGLKGFSGDFRILICKGFLRPALENGDKEPGAAGQVSEVFQSLN